MLSHSGLGDRFWGEALYEAVYNFNRIPSSKSSTPYEMFFNKPADLTDFHKFGASAFIQIPKLKRRKLDDNALKVIYVGHDERAKGKIFLNPKTGKVVRATGEIFLEASQY
jgi:hypothetical protein